MKGVNTPMQPAPGSHPHWLHVALPLAPLFLNFYFWFVLGSNFAFPGRFLASVPYLLAAALVPTLFFLVPAFAVQRAGTPILTIAAQAWGAGPALLLRLAFIWFLLIWLAQLAWTFSWLLAFPTQLARPVIYVLVSAILAFLFFTSLPNGTARSKMALFSTKLAGAVLFAALIRVHEGLPGVLPGYPVFTQDPPLFLLWRAISGLLVYAAPILFLAAAASRSFHPRQLLNTAATGVALPLATSLLLTTIVSLATLRSSFYQPSLNPNIAMALWGKAAHSATLGIALIAALTLFGAARLAARQLLYVLSPPDCSRRATFTIIILLSVVITAFSPMNSPVHRSEAPTATFIAIAAAILTAQCLRPASHPRLAALLSFSVAASLAVGIYLWSKDHDAAWWHPEILPAAFAAVFLHFLFLWPSRIIKQNVSPHSSDRRNFPVD